MPKFAEFISKISVDTIYSDLSKWKQRFINAISAQENYLQRLCGKYSLIFITAQYANKAFSFGFDLDKIFNLLVKIARDNLAFRSANNTDNAYNLLVDYVIKNKANFVVYDKRRHFDIAPDAHLLGAIKDLRDDNYQNEVIFYLDAFKSIIKNLNLGGERKVLQNLKKKGVLIHDNNRLTTKRTVISGAEPIWTYVVKMNISSSNKIGVSPHVVELDCSVDDLSELG